MTAVLPSLLMHGKSFQRKLENNEFNNKLIAHYKKNFLNKIKNQSLSFLNDFDKKQFIQAVNDAINNEQEQEYFCYRSLRFVNLYNQQVKKIISQQIANKWLVKYLEKRLKCSTSEINQHLKNGNISLNNKIIDQDVIMESHDKLKYFEIQRTEPVTYDLQVEIQNVQNNIALVNKPSTISVFQNQTYNKSSLKKLLQQNQQISNLTIIQPIDRCFSGLVLLSLNPMSKTELFQTYIQYVKKCKSRQFYARVSGLFPEKEQHIKERVDLWKFEGLHSKNQYPFRSQYLMAHSFDIETYQLMEGIQESKYNLISYDSKTDTSLVHCEILKGSNKQLRRNLSKIGNPVINDIANKGRFVGNLWLEEQNKDIFNSENIKEYRTQIILRHQSLLTQIERQKNDGFKGNISLKNQNNSNPAYWSIIKIFEMFVHGYNYTYKDVNGKPNLEQYSINDLPYWYDAKNIQQMF